MNSTKNLNINIYIVIYKVINIYISTILSLNRKDIVNHIQLLLIFYLLIF